jgi:hypothetical protein
MYIYYFIIFFLSSALYALHETNLLQELELNRQHHEHKHLIKIFEALDNLFQNSVIKIQKIDENNKIGTEKSSNLYDFITKPHNKDKIIKLLTRNLNFSSKNLEYIKNNDYKSFYEALSLLSEKKYISSYDLNRLFANYAFISAEEIIKLIENGASITKSGYFIQLRTGDYYGDVLKFQDEFDIIIRKIQEEHNIILPDEPLLALLNGPYREYIIRAFESSGMSLPNAVSDAHVLNQIRKYFSFLATVGRVSGVSPGGFGSHSVVDTQNATSISFSPQHLSSALLSNFYFNTINASLSNSLSISPVGIGYGGNLAFAHHGPDWWLYYSDGYLGAGFNYTVNFDQQAQWSNSYASYLSMGGSLSGWKNQLSAGITLQTLLSNSVGVGASVYVNVAREHDVMYLDTYPLDGKFASIRGLDHIEINDKNTKGLSGTFALNFVPAGVPLAVAFKANTEHIHARTYRTHTKMAQAQAMLKESDLSTLLFNASKKIKESRIPSFEHPEVLIDGDELIEIKTGKLSGTFVVGLQTVIPISALRVGTSTDISAEFELGLRRLPNDKFEVSIEPRRIHEMSIFASMLDMLGAGHIKAMALARKQIFIFDFKHPEGKRAYFDLIHQGRLPVYDEIEVSTEDRGPEHLLAEFRAHNTILRKWGVQRIYLEAINVATAKAFAGFNAPIIPAILFLVRKAHNALHKNHRRLEVRFEGKDKEFMRSQASNVATNGIIAVRRITSGGRISEGQGFSGRFNQDLFVTHRRIHTILEKSHGYTENSWAFDSLILHAQLEDSIITNNEENIMVDLVNKLFNAYIGSFEYKNTKAHRIIHIERELRKSDFENLLGSEAKDRLYIASQASGIDYDILVALLKKLKHKHSDQQGLIVKHFVESSAGLSGFSAIHQLLGGRPEHIIISTESGYMNVVEEANNFIIRYSDPRYNNKGKIAFSAEKTKMNKKIIKNFYREARHNLREIDYYLRLLYDDRYLIDDKSTLYTIFTKDYVEDLVKNNLRQNKTTAKSALISARNTILGLMNLSAQGFNHNERIIIYGMAKKKNLRLAEKAEIFIYNNFFNILEDNIYEEGIDLLDKINTRVLKLSEDKIMNSIDPAYVKKQLATWQILSQWIQRIIMPK